MPSSIIVIGAVDGVRRDLEKYLGDRARLLIVRLVRNGGFRLEPYPDNAVRMVEAAADRADSYNNVLVIQLPYATCPDKLTETVEALKGLGATVVRPSPGATPWPSRPGALDGIFQRTLGAALEAEFGKWLAANAPAEAAAAAVARARRDFADTLRIPHDVVIESSENGAFWYPVLRALHELCQIERLGLATDKRSTLGELLGKHANLPKQTYKVADTGVFAKHPGSGERLELRERVHLVEGSPSETESVYWITIGNAQTEYRYLIGRIGRHA